MHEREVLQGIVEDLSEKQMAYRLGLSASTVHIYKHWLYKKLQMLSRGELIGRASQ